jgi:hypothetical protein
MNAMAYSVFLPLPLGEGRGEGLRRIVPESQSITVPALSLTLSQRERGPTQGSAS